MQQSPYHSTDNTSVKSEEVIIDKSSIEGKREEEQKVEIIEEEPIKRK